MEKAILVLGDQLFSGLPGMPPGLPVVMREDWGLCTRTRHHRQKIVLFLAAMRAFAAELDRPVDYQKLEESRGTLIESLAEIRELWAYEPADSFFRRELEAGFPGDVHWVSNPSFLTPPGAWKGRLHMADFYMWQRRRLGILLEPDGSPTGGRWSFDTENRQKIPRGVVPPAWLGSKVSPETREVMEMVDRLFPGHPGRASDFAWPVTRAEALEELQEFVSERLELFGPYEDALSQAGGRLWHSGLSPLINMGLLSPMECVRAAVGSGASLASVEGFVRQIIGWREFIKVVADRYEEKGIWYGDDAGGPGGGGKERVSGRAPSPSGEAGSAKMRAAVTRAQVRPLVRPDSSPHSGSEKDGPAELGEERFGSDLRGLGIERAGAVPSRREEGTTAAPNALGHDRLLAPCWWDGSTGLPPLDAMIRGCQSRGWSHHIERLMVAGSVMLMCEVHPRSAYDWFMEMFVDSADWVMAPNVFGMSQFSDGGLFATKPYLSGSAYILKMSDWPKGDWCETWDGLYWRFIHRHRGLVSGNPRMSMAVATLEKMDGARRERIFTRAEEFVGRVTSSPC